MAIAVFDYTAWQTRYPEFNGAVSESMAALLFAEAGLYLDNTDGSRVTDPARRLLYLNMIVAHLAALSGVLEAGGKPTGLVGRVTSATEGSVSVSVETGLAPGTGGWWTQTPYGFAFWSATKRLRSATYVPGIQPSFEPMYGRGAWRR